LAANFLGHEKALKMHGAVINFVGFTAQINSALHCQGNTKGDFGILRGVAGMAFRFLPSWWW